MTRSGAWIVLLIAVMPVLAACASGRPTAATPATRKPPVTTSAEPTGALSLSPTPSAGTRTSVHIGPFTQVFAGPPPASPAQARVLAQFRKGQVLWARSDSAWHLVAPVKDYVTGSALTHLRAAVSNNRVHGLVLAGTDLFYNIRVTAMTARSATVTTCDDAGKFREENARTGRTDPAYTPPAAQSFGMETWHMVPRSGHWAIRSLTFTQLSNPPGSPCQR